jgi:rubrerythrin
MYNRFLELNPLIFSNNLKKILPQKHSNFVEEFFYEWLYNTYLGEFETTIAYPKLLAQFKNNQHMVLPDSDLHDICGYFDKMIEDETEHAALLEKLIDQYFNKSIKLEDLQKVRTETLSKLDTSELTNSLTYYYVGECCLWTGFYLMYKNCKDDKIAKIFHHLLVDESHHHNNIFKIYKKIKHNTKLDIFYFINEVRHLKYFGFHYVKKVFEFGDSINEKNTVQLRLIYNQEWQKKFDSIFLKKTYKLYELFNPESNFNNYCQMVNE